MKNCLAALLLTLSAPAWALEISPEKDQHYRKTGDNVIFKVQLDKGRKNLHFIAEIDGNNEIRNSNLRVLADGNGQAEISVPALKSGFILVTVKDNGKKAAAGVAVDPAGIRPGRQKSAAFDQYWNAVKNEFDLSPVRYELTELPDPKAGFKAYEVKFLLGGEGKDGYAALTIPAKAVPGRCAARVVFQPAGVDYARPLYYADTITLVVNPLPIKHNGPNMSQTIKPEGKFFRYWNWMPNDPKNVFPDMFERVLRSLQFVKSLPEWDQRTLIVSGRSQGGAQALAAAGMDPQVTMCVAYVPALCDHGGYAAGNVSGWPRYCNFKEYRDDPEKILTKADLIDVTFFAQNITDAEVVVSCGFIDTTCFPASVHAAFNVIPAKNKMMINDLHSTHSTPGSTYSKGEKRIAEHIKKMQSALK